MLRISILIIAAAFLSTSINSCGNKNKKVVKDTTITPQTAITQLVLDSLSVENFIVTHSLKDSSARRLRNFYISRNFQYAWFTEDGLAEQALAFWNLRNHYVQFNRDTSLNDKILNERMAQLTAGDSGYSKYNEDTRQTELKLTQQFFQYAQYAYAGKIDPEELQWHIPRKKLDPVALLDSLVKNKGNNLKDWEPVNSLYARMQHELERYATAGEKGGWDSIRLKKNQKFSVGSGDSLVLKLRQRLLATGDLADTMMSIKFDSTVKKAVQRAQKRFGFKESGSLDETLAKALNVPVEYRIQQLLINMERMRWLPRQNHSNFIVANIPEFMLHIYEDGKEVMDMNIVVGAAASKSVIFSDQLKYVVFSPYWNVPSSITRNEIVPGMKRNPNYLSSKNMEITGYSGSLPIVRQKPGGSNSLGLVKFIFPNSYNIYFHDTPSKSLFQRDRRDLSHGCIRLSQPFELAKYLLRKDTSWTDTKIREAMNKGSEKWVSLNQSVPVYITYFTAWVDNNNLAHFREDIYGHDGKMAERLFK